MRIDNARFTGSILGSQAVASLSGSFTGSGHIELSNTASYNFASASISASSLILYRGSGITGQTSSLEVIAATSDTASYVSSSNVDGPLGFDSVQTASYAVTASYALSASFEVKKEVSSSYADTASFVTASGVYGPFGSNSVISSSYAVSASQAESASFATTASYAVSASLAQTASYAVSASHLIGLQHSITASFVNQTTFTANHSFDSEDVVVQIYQDDASTGNIPTLIVPNSITLPTRNSATATFAVPTTGYMVVSRGGFLRSGSIQTALTASIANAVQNPITGGLGIVAFNYDGAIQREVALDTSSAHFTTGVSASQAPIITSLSSSASTAREFYLTTASISGLTQSFTKGDGSTFEINLPDTGAVDLVFSMSNGLGIDTFTFDNTANAGVQVDTSSAHFTVGVSASQATTLTNLSASLTTTDQTVSGSVAALSASADLARNALSASFAGTRFVGAVNSATPTTFNVVHSLNELFPIVQSYDAANNMVIPVTVNIASANQVDVTFAAAFTGNIIVQK